MGTSTDRAYRIVSIGVRPNTYIRLDGSSLMRGNLNVGNYRITNLMSPDNNTDEANKEYVDRHLHHSGGTMSRDMSMGGSKITNLAAPTATGDTANKAYVDIHVLPLTEETMAENIYMNSYMITNLSSPHNASDSTNKFGLDGHMHKSGGVMTCNTDMIEW